MLYIYWQYLGNKQSILYKIFCTVLYVMLRCQKAYLDGHTDIMVYGYRWAVKLNDYLQPISYQRYINNIREEKKQNSLINKIVSEEQTYS